MPRTGWILSLEEQALGSARWADHAASAHNGTGVRPPERGSLVNCLDSDNLRSRSFARWCMPMAPSRAEPVHAMTSRGCVVNYAQTSLTPRMAPGWGAQPPGVATNGTNWTRGIRGASRPLRARTPGRSATAGACGALPAVAGALSVAIVPRSYLMECPTGGEGLLPFYERHRCARQPSGRLKPGKRVK
jgi:hypothetical protein